MLKYSALILAAAVAVAVAADPQEANVVPQASAGTAVGEVTWKNVLECFKSPKSAVDCLEVRMDRAVGVWRETTVRMARSDPDTSPEDATNVGDIVQEIGDLITYGISRFFRGDEEEAANASAAGEMLDVEEGRGHHKKKKIQKEIKKFVLKILFGIFLVKQKIKMIIMTIQSILMSKFLIVAMIYALSNTFKIWYDIKKSKHHHHDKVVYYENAHHQHHYEPPEHSEYDDHHQGWSGGIWGRSIAATEPGIIEQGSNGGGHESISRFIRRVQSRPEATTGQAQHLAYNGQRPSAPH
ncbi:uncharacterized protein LOC126844237 [Adelges cooleyi]|uniref:uncharacterized protein LOC126844237 n=1 Tax=Adelges cooleyi TaxID=133065 RepID=UPI0021806610|nr:uncharacterized protein LOC126844237 [Adelges cooleyi]